MDPQLSVDVEKDALLNLDKIYGKRLGALLRHLSRRTHGILVSLRSDGFTRVGPVIRRLGMTEQQLVFLVATSIDEEQGFRFEMMTYNDQKWVRACWGHTVEGVYPHLVEQPAEECFDQRRPPASEAADFVPFTAMVGRFADAVPAAAAASFAMPPEPPPALPACIGEMQEREMQERSALISQLDTQSPEEQRQQLRKLPPDVQGEDLLMAPLFFSDMEDARPNGTCQPLHDKGSCLQKSVHNSRQECAGI